VTTNRRNLRNLRIKKSWPNSDQNRGPEVPLLAEILAEIRTSGPLTLARYMELCLYHPEFGYYRSGRAKLGPSGDFYTSAHVHPAFARLLVKRWSEMWEEQGGGPFTLVEGGAGGGELARAAEDWAARAYPEFARFFRYVPVEFGQPFPERVRGCIFSNEFFDAQPVHVLRCHRGELDELHVGERDGRLCWVPAPLSSPEPAAWLSRLSVEPAEGQLLEVSPAAAGWMRRFADMLECGYVLAFDYGYRAREISAGRRFPQGSLMTYRGHTASDEIFRDPGDRDISAHVNFDLLRAAGAEAGLKETAFCTQGAYLVRLGEATQFTEAFADCSSQADRIRASLLLKNLIFGIGETVQVLEMRH
jgi:SAM-dependent MidA family methyltransferase